MAIPISQLAGILALLKPPGGVIYPLDPLSATAVRAYELRLLRSAYAGPCINVRRSSDNAATDIGFVLSGSYYVLDVATLLTFCGSGNGFVTTWYDQSSSAANLTQATAANQMQIVSSGVYLGSVQNISSTNGYMFTTNPVTATGAFSLVTPYSSWATLAGYNCLTQMGYTTNRRAYIGNTTTLLAGVFFTRNSSSSNNAFNPGGTPPTGKGISTLVHAAGAAESLTTAYLSGTSIGVGTDPSVPSGTPTNLYIGGWLGTAVNTSKVNFYGGVLFNSAISTADRQSYEHDLEAYYSIPGV
jgi:hypothetical protein